MQSVTTVVARGAKCQSAKNVQMICMHVLMIQSVGKGAKCNHCGRQRYKMSVPKTCANDKYALNNSTKRWQRCKVKSLKLPKVQSVKTSRLV